MLIKFIKNMDYNGLIYGQGSVYDIRDTEDGFIGRCIRRGHEKLESYDGEILLDLRFKKESNKEEKKLEKKDDEKVSEGIEDKPEEKIESEESEEKPKPKRKKRTKKSQE